MVMLMIMVRSFDDDDEMRSFHEEEEEEEDNEVLLTIKKNLSFKKDSKSKLSTVLPWVAHSGLAVLTQLKLDCRWLLLLLALLLMLLPKLKSVCVNVSFNSVGSSVARAHLENYVTYCFPFFLVLSPRCLSVNLHSFHALLHTSTCTATQHYILSSHVSFLFLNLPGFS